MKHLPFIVLSLFPAAIHAQSQPGVSAATPLPRIVQNGAVKQMFVDGKPFLMLAGELHKSSASNVEYLKPIWWRNCQDHDLTRPAGDCTGNRLAHTVGIDE